MAYSITKTNGNLIATVQDATINTTATSLTLIGRDYAGYGAFLNENFVHLMEHFASNLEPAKKITGQIWYDTGVIGGGTLKVWNEGANIWKPVGSSIAQDGQPASGTSGDLWFDTANNQLNAWSQDDSDWILIGPPSTLAGSGAVVTTITDSSSNSHVVIEFKVNNNIVGIISYDSTFTPQTAIAGFSTIKPGFNLVSSSTLTGAQFTGDASNALYLNGVTAGQFLRSDQNTSTAYQITAGGGIVIGSDLNIVASTANNEVRISGTTNNRDINFYANVAGDTSIRPIAISGSTGSVSFEKSVNISENLSATGTLSITGATTLVGAVTVQNGLLPTTDDSIDIGASNQRFNEVYASSFVGNLINGNVTTTSATISGWANVAVGVTIAGSPVVTYANITNYVQTLGKNSQGNKTISATPPTSGSGSNGDIWYQI